MRDLIEPVVPFDLNTDWNLISRTILSYYDTDNIPFNGESGNGFGDTLQSFFSSPKKATEGGWIWGAESVLLAPTASSRYLGSDNWAFIPLRLSNALKTNGM